MDEYQINNFPPENPVIAQPEVSPAQPEVSPAQPEASPAQPDPGEKSAKLCKVFGILSIFILHVPFAIVSFILYGRCVKIGNGANLDKAKTGRTCAVIGIVLLVVLIAAFYICRPFIADLIDKALFPGPIMTTNPVF